MHIPDLYAFKSLPAFFEAFIRENKQKNPRRFSHGYFAKKLKWPRALLGDLASGRKALSVSRALEFSQHFGFNILTTERLILLCLIEKTPHRNELLNRWYGDKTPGFPRPSASVDREMCRSVHLSAVYDFLRFRNEVPSPDEAAGALPAISGLTSRAVEKCYVWLTNKGYIRKNKSKLTFVAQKNLFVEETGMKATTTHFDYASNFHRYCEIMEQGQALRLYSTVNSLFLKLPQPAIAAFQQRLIEVVNWATSFESSLTETDHRNTSLYQLTLNLFPVEEKGSSKRSRYANA